MIILNGMFIESNFQTRCDRRRLKCWSMDWEFFFFYIGLIWFFSKIVIIDKRYYKDGKILHETKWFSKGLIKKNVWKKRIEKNKEEINNEK